MNGLYFLNFTLYTLYNLQFLGQHPLHDHI
jgi:hypothetical protein